MPDSEPHAWFPAEFRIDLGDWTERIESKLNKALALLIQISEEVSMTAQEETALLAAVSNVAAAQGAEAAALATVQADITQAVTILQTEDASDPEIDAATATLSVSATALGNSVTALNAAAASLQPFLPAPSSSTTSSAAKPASK